MSSVIYSHVLGRGISSNKCQERRINKFPRPASSFLVVGNLALRNSLLPKPQMIYFNCRNSLLPKPLRAMPDWTERLRDRDRKSQDPSSSDWTPFGSSTNSEERSHKELSWSEFPYVWGNPFTATARRNSREFFQKMLTGETLIQLQHRERASKWDQF